MTTIPMAALVLIASALLPPASFSAPPFEGRIAVAVTQGGQASGLLYTVGTNWLRIAVTATNWPHPVDLVDRQSGAVTLLYPHNRSFVRLPAVSGAAPAVPPLPPGIGPQALSPGASALPGMGGMPMMPAMPREPIELQATPDKTNLLGFACVRYEVKQRGETLEVWATDQLLPFQAYQRNQPNRFGPRMLEEQWPALLTAHKLFPLLVSLRFDNGSERYRLEVTSVQTEQFADPDGKLFQPPPDYNEMKPLPF